MSITSATSASSQTSFQVSVSAVSDWPEAATVINADGASDWLIICEHASAHIPQEFERLGLPEAERRAHIAWDPGAAELTRVLSERLNAVAVLANYSRLLIDLNRPVESSASIPEVSEVTTIPGNVDLDEAGRSLRIERIFNPFHDTINNILEDRLAAGRKTRIVTVHSFTPVFKGTRRPWHLGILSDASHPLAEIFRERISARDEQLVAALDEPYQVELGDDMAIPVHGDARGLDALLLEVRNDTLDAPGSVDAWATLIAATLNEI